MTVMAGSLSPFEPIAIVGQGCVLPGAFETASLWSLLVEGRSAIASIPEVRWRAARNRLLISPQAQAAGREGCLTDRGGWVTGFEAVFDPVGLGIDPALIARLDPLVAWLLHAGRAALTEAGLKPGVAALRRAGAIFGHLAYPSAGLAEFAEAYWLGKPLPEPMNRFNAGLPADLLCRGLGLGAGGFSLDAACASSLYAVKLACDRLQAREVDLMLAGGISRIDPLVLHAGFTALGALSASGRSRPFHAEADGLLPAEGAALVALKRLEDAERDGDRVLAVILGIGLTNDGRSGGLLAPSVEGQARAMARALASAGVDPADVSLIECHATGTLLGDATEIVSTGRVYAGPGDMPVGSIKSNFGHLTTASGAVGLLKLVLALNHGIRPPTLDCDPLAASVAQSRFRPVRQAEPWPDASPRIAAISNFGFGGANAHLLLGEASAVSARTSERRSFPAAMPVARIAVVGLGVRVADGEGVADFRRHLMAAAPRGKASAIGFRPGEIRFPPRDLERTLPQQLLMLRAVIDAITGVAHLPAETGVFVGAQTDAECCRHGLRLRLPESAPHRDLESAIGFALDSAGTVGGMPNVPANRVNVQFDLCGAGFTIAAEELSGLRALEQAVRALRAGEIDAAVAGAVDLSVEPVHTAALKAVAPGIARSGDGAVALVLKREADALRDGDTVIALVDTGAGEAGDGLDWTPFAQRVTAVFGHAHAASGLIEAVAAILAVQDGQLPPERLGATPQIWPASIPRRILQRRSGLGGQMTTLRFTAPNAAAHSPIPR